MEVVNDDSASFTAGPCDLKKDDDMDDDEALPPLPPMPLLPLPPRRPSSGRRVLPSVLRAECLKALLLLLLLLLLLWLLLWWWWLLLLLLLNIITDNCSLVYNTLNISVLILFRCLLDRASKNVKFSVYGN